LEVATGCGLPAIMAAVLSSGASLAPFFLATVAISGAANFLAVPLINESSRDLPGLLLLTISPLFQLAQRRGARSGARQSTPSINDEGANETEGAASAAFFVSERSRHYTKLI
jgi:hypothetical protein